MWFNYFSAQEEKDGISPPVLEEVTKFKKLKAVTFKETVNNHSNSLNNTSSNNTSGSDLKKSCSVGEENALRTVLKVEPDSDKENWCVLQWWHKRCSGDVFTPHVFNIVKNENTILMM